MPRSEMARRYQRRRDRFRVNLTKASELKPLPIAGLRRPSAWRVTNTDQEAANADCRDFYDSSEGLSRWEHLAYRGVHLIEAFSLKDES